MKRWLGLQGGGFALLLLASFASAVYWGIAAERHQHLREEVQRLAATAAGQLPLIAHEFHEVGNSHKFHSDQEVLTGEDAIRQRLRWYDRSGRLVEEQGSLKVPPPAVAAQRPGLIWRTWPGGLALWQPVYTRPRHGHGGSPTAQLSGYVQVGLSDQAVEAELARLRRGLLLGTITAVLMALVVGRSMLRSSLAPLQRQVLSLQRFTADASHELRHPLTLIRTLLASAPAAAESAEPGGAGTGPLLDRLDRLAARMANLLDDLLLLARHEQNLGEGACQRGQWRRFDLLELLDDLLEIYGTRAAERGVRLLLESPQPELQVWGEPERLQRLFTNVLVNAIRHSPAGAVVTVRTGRQAGKLRVEIIDSGEGIAAADRERVFERFWRGTSASGGSDPGEESGRSGLGLAIARAIARGHGGEIHVAEGDPGHCVLLVLLPAA